MAFSFLGAPTLSKEKGKVKMLYNQPNDYKLTYINGVYGGITPRGDIMCHFFLEYLKLPEEEEFSLTGGKIGELVKKEGETPVINRDLKVGITLKADCAENIANWLLAKVNILKGEKNLAKVKPLKGEKT